MRGLLISSLSCVMALRLKTKIQSQISMPFNLESAESLKIPSSENVTLRYCDEDPSSTPRLDSASILMEYGAYESDGISREHMLYGKCEDDEECGFGSKGRPYCVDGICRECREGYEFEDCHSLSAFCSADNGYTCSTCASDNDCPSKSYCRTVATSASFGSGKMPRKECVKCDMVPEPGEVIDTTTCDWRCPIEQYLLSATSPGEQASCLDCPSCSAGQFYAPHSSPRTHFYSSCTNATDIVCNECSSIGIDDSKAPMCAKLLSPSTRHLNDEFVGDLGSHFPCRFFECKQGWFLSGTRSKCKKCHLTMCPSGEFLAGCGKADPGVCKPCKGRLPRGAYFIDPTDPQYVIVNPEDTCQFQCGKDKVFDDDSNACLACDANASADEETSCGSNRVYRLGIA